MNGSLFISYLLTLIVLMLIPGPDMLFCLATGLKGGPRSGFLAALGAATGEVIHITAVAAGLTALFRAAPLLFDAVRLLGAAYLIWLGVQALRHRDHRIVRTGDGGRSPSRAYARGLLTNLLNPKVALFAVALLPQFTDPQAGSLALQFLVLGACFVALEIAVDGSIGLVAGRLARLLRGRRASRNLNLTAGSIYLGLGAKIALER